MALRKIILEEQGLRDGLQTIPVRIPVETKLRWIGMLAAAGLRRIQVASFVHPGLVPQMADAEAVIAGLPVRADVVYSALALNPKGVERAALSGLRHLSISLSASDAHSRKNANCSLEESLPRFREMVRMAGDAGISVRAGIQCAFGCRYEGAVAEQRVLDLVGHHIDCGVAEIALADSTGMGFPAQVSSLMGRVVRMAEGLPVSLHLHNTENKGYANLFAAIEAGVTRFDTAFGGLGGCPFIKGATGNIATEDTAHMLAQSGCETGIDIRKVAEVSAEMEALLGHRLPGLLYPLVGRRDAAMT